MTNRALLNLPEALLGALDKQRVFLLRVESVPMPCPACKKPINVFEAAGIDVDAYDFGTTRYEYRCPGCAAELEQMIPFIAGGHPLWLWQCKNGWLQEQLRKARAFDQQAPAHEEP